MTLKSIYRGAMDDFSRKFTDITNEHFSNMQHEMQHKKNKTLVNTRVLLCGRWDLNPHDRNDHKILSLARLPVPTLPLDLRHE